MKKAKYSFREGSKVNLDPQVVGETLEQIRVDSGGKLTAPAVLDSARKKRSPLHKYFEWDDTEAAESWRRHQASCLIVSVTIIEPKAEAPVRAFPYIKIEGEGSFTSMKIAMSDEQMRRQVIEKAKRELIAWKQRYHELVEFAKLFAVIDEMEIAR